MNFFFVILLGLVAITNSEEAKDSVSDVRDQRMEQWVPVITEELCKEERYKHLRTCQLLTTNRDALSQVTRAHRCFFHKENATVFNAELEQKHRDILRVRAQEKRDLTSKSRRSASSLYAAIMDFVGMNAPAEEVAVQNAPATRSLQKRSSSSVNQCVPSFYTHASVTYAKDIDTDEVHEVFHNPAEGLYQTFKIFPCVTAAAYSPPAGYSCVPEYTIYETVVYTYPTGPETHTTFVAIPSSCALHKDL